MNKIDSIRKRKCMSYEDIAKASGLTSAYICLLAKDKRKNPSVDAMKKIAIALGEKTDKVFDIN